MVSENAKVELERTQFAGLNPCSCGGWSQSAPKALIAQVLTVLILVLVEDGLRALYV